MKIKVTHIELGSMLRYMHDLTKSLTIRATALHQMGKSMDYRQMKAEEELAGKLRDKFAKKIVDRKKYHTITLLKVEGLLFVKYNSSFNYNSQVTEAHIYKITTDIDKQII